MGDHLADGNLGELDDSTGSLRSVHDNKKHIVHRMA